MRNIQNFYYFQGFEHWDLTTVFIVIEYVECFKRAGLPNDCELLLKNPSSSIEAELKACLERNDEAPELFRTIVNKCVPAKA